MANWETEYFVKITPRRKNDWGFASIGNDYNNFNSAEEYIKYYEKTCQNIVDNIKEHYNDFDIKYVEVATNEHEQELEEKVEALTDKLYTAIEGLKLFCGEKVSYHVSSEIDATHAKAILKELGVEK